MKKITTMLNSPAKLAGFALGIVILAAIILFAGMQAMAGSDENKTIGMDKGVNIALDDAGIRLEAAENLNAHYDTDDGISVYEVSFNAGGYEYDYVIKAANGKILEAERSTLSSSDAEKVAKADTDEKTSSDKKQSDAASTVANGSAKLTKEKAKSIALKHAGISESKASFVKVEKDYEDGILVYEVEFYSGNTEYDYEINANTGEILSYDKDIENYTIPSASGSDSAENSSSGYIGADKAKSIALKDAGLSASSVTFTKAKLDREDGIRVYEIEFFVGSTEYEYEINATTGKILDKDIDTDDDFDDDWD